MIIDAQNLFSDDQAITASAASTNVIDLGAYGYGDHDGPRRAKILCQVTEAFTADGAATLTVAVKTGTTASTDTTVITTAAIGKASLVAGYQFTVEVLLPSSTSRYLDLYYTVATGPMTAGKITAGMVLDRQSAYV